MKIIYVHILIIFLLFLCVKSGKSVRNRENDQDYVTLEKNIQSLKVEIERRTKFYRRNEEDDIDIDKNNELGALWGQLAMTLQAKDVMFHEDSVKYQPEAVSFIHFYLFEKL